MGEEKKEEEVKVEGTKEVEKKEEEEKKEDKVEEPKPPSPVVLYVDLHCVGCARKIERSLMRYRGVEGVVIDMAQNQITVKGVVDPQALCMLIQKKTKRRASVLSPLPAADAQGEPATSPQFVTSQVSGLITVELNVNMHCEACAQQLKRKILKMRGVQTAEADSVTSKVTVTGTMDAQRLVDYVYRRTKKQAQIVPQPEPDPEPKVEPEKAEEKKDDGEKPAAEAPKAEEAKEENGEKKEEEKAAEVEKKGEEKVEESKEEKVEGSKEEVVKVEAINHDERNDRMMYYYPPLYVIERIPAPQIFSDENPNACCIS